MKKILTILFLLPSVCFGQITVSVPVGLQSSTSATSKTLSSINLDAEVLYILGVSTTDNVSPEAPTISNTGTATFTLITSIDYNTTGTPRNRLSLYRFLGSAQSTIGITATFLNTQDRIGMYIIRVNGADKGGTNGSAAIQEVVTNNSNATANPSLTLTGYSLNSVALYFFSSDNFTTSWATPEAGWTQLFNSIISNQPNDAVGFQLNATDLTPSITAASSDWGGIAIEVGPAVKKGLPLYFFN